VRGGGNESNCETCFENGGRSRMGGGKEKKMRQSYALNCYRGKRNIQPEKVGYVHVIKKKRGSWKGLKTQRKEVGELQGWPAQETKKSCFPGTLRGKKESPEMVCCPKEVEKEVRKGREGQHKGTGSKDIVSPKKNKIDELGNRGGETS